MANKPKIRFKGFDDAWEQRKLGDLVKEGILEAPLDGNHGEKHPTSDEYVDSGIPFLMASDIHNGEVNIYSCKYITKERAERLDKGFARNGDVLLTHKATIGETAILSKLTTKYAMLTPQVTYYRIKNEERLNREYLYSFFNSLDFQTELKTKAAQSTRPYIGITAQQNLRIILPKEIDEQRKIGLYFRNLDHLITLHQRKCDQVKELKKYMLTKMFPQNGAKVPEIRFDGFTDDWEQRKVSELCSISTGKSNTQDKVEDGEYPFYVRSPIIERSTKYLYDEEAVLTVGDGVGTGKVFHYVNGKYDLHQRCYRMYDFTDELNAHYFYHTFSKSFYKRVMAMTAKTSVDSVRLEMIANMEIPAPKIEEQVKIGTYFDNLDNLITLHQSKCENLKNLKKYMLRKMFV